MTTRVKRVVALALAAAGLFLAGSAAWAKAAYFVQADVVRGAVGAMGAVCVPNSVFSQGEEVVWRAYVYDAATGELLTQDDIDAKGVQVFGQLDGGVKVPLHYEAHPPGAPKQELYWAGAWQIPVDYATGDYAWSVAVEDSAGGSGLYEPMGHTAGLSTLNIVAPPAAAPAAAPEAAAPVAAVSTEPAPDGAKLFASNCAACHQAEGQGVPGAFPPLAANSVVAGADPTWLIRVALYGLQGKIEVGGDSFDGSMPAWVNVFDDAQLAAILTYVRGNFGNSAAPVTAEAVAAQRAEPGSPDANYADYPR